MVFGYLVVQRLLILVRVLSHLPDWVSLWFARMLNAASLPFHAVNFYGTNVAPVVYNRNRMGAKMDRVIDALQRSLIRRDDINDAYCVDVMKQISATQSALERTNRVMLHNHLGPASRKPS